MRWSTNRVLAATAAIFAVGALFAGDVQRTVPVDDQVSPVQLATWIRDRNATLRIIDVRDSASFREYQIPTADNITAHTIDDARFTQDQLIVLYALDEDPVREWAALKKRGLNAKVLSGGLGGWLGDIMQPALPPNASAEQTASYQKKKELAEYFGGQPSVYTEQSSVSPSTLQSLKRLKRRTC